MSNSIKTKFLLFALMPISSLFGIVGSLDLFHQSEVVSMYFQPESVKGRGVKSVIVVLDFENMQTSQDGKKFAQSGWSKIMIAPAKELGSRVL